MKDYAMKVEDIVDMNDWGGNGSVKTCPSGQAYQSQTVEQNQKFQEMVA